MTQKTGLYGGAAYGQELVGGPLTGLKIVELGGIGPGPLAATLLSDLGADVVRIDRRIPSGLGVPRPSRFDLLRRGRKSVAVDLKKPAGIELILSLIESADVLLDPFRPGTLEKLGLGPDACWRQNARLVYARMTGWGQSGPLSQAAGHDINYLALSGALHAIGPGGGKPVPPLNLLADMGGGGMFLAVGVLAAVYEASRSGKGQVVDVSMVEGVALLAAGNYGLQAAGLWKNEREANIIDGGAHFYATYETGDGRYISVGAIEAKFYQILLEKIGLADAELPEQMDQTQWPRMREMFAEIFASKTSTEWCELMEGSDACFAPVLRFDEAPSHAHNMERGSFIELDGVTQPGPAPRFSRTIATVDSPPPDLGMDTESALQDWGIETSRIDQLMATDVIGWAKQDEPIEKQPK
jgi:alpha-methylacyl-CoA racemase